MERGGVGAEGRGVVGTGAGSAEEVAPPLVQLPSVAVRVTGVG
jgi:hypothetical protein